MAFLSKLTGNKTSGFVKRWVKLQIPQTAKHVRIIITDTPNAYASYSEITFYDENSVQIPKAGMTAQSDYGNASYPVSKTINEIAETALSGADAWCPYHQATLSSPNVARYSLGGSKTIGYISFDLLQDNWQSTGSQVIKEFIVQFSNDDTSSAADAINSPKWFEANLVNGDSTGANGFAGQIVANNFPIGVSLTSPEASWQRFEENNAKLQYTGYVYVGSNGGYQYRFGSLQIKFKFYGTKLRLLSYSTQQQSYSRTSKVIVDGVEHSWDVAPIDAVSAAAAGYVLSFEKLGLTEGIHEVIINPDLHWINLDAIDIDSTGHLVALPGVGMRIPTPEPKWRRYDGSERAKPIGLMAPGTADANNYWNGTTFIASAIGAGAEYRFYGTKVRIVDYRHTGRSTNISVEIDGVKENYSSYGTDVPHMLMYEKTGLPLGWHTMRVTNETSAYINIDCIDIDEDGIMAAQTGSILTTSEPGWKRIEENTFGINAPGYTSYSGVAHSGGSMMFASDARNRPITFSFLGSKLRIIAPVNPTTYAQAVEVVIDGEVKQTYSHIAPAVINPMLLADIQGLEYKVHDVEIRLGVDSTNFTILLDAIEIDDTGQLIIDATKQGTILTTAGPGWTRYENNNANLSYYGSWATSSGGYQSGGSAHATSRSSKGEFRFKFKGTSFRIIGSVDPRYSPEIIVSVDGVKAGVFSAQAESDNMIPRMLYQQDELEDREHYVMIHAAVSSAAVGDHDWRVDALDLPATDVLLPFAATAVIGGPLTSVSGSWKRYDEASVMPMFKKKGTWAVTVATGSYSGYIYSANSADAMLEVKFYGTKFRILSLATVDRASHIIVNIDGEETRCNSRVLGQCAQTLIFEKIGLAEGYHRVKIYNAPDAEPPTGAIYFDVDAFEVDSAGRLLHPDEVRSIEEITGIGCRIRANYNATSNAVGMLSGFGEETLPFLASNAVAAPNGDFYMIVVDRTHDGKWKMIPDRNLQTSISYTRLQEAGLTTGIKLDARASEIPKMTGPTSPSGRAFASSEYNQYAQAWMGFDKTAFGTGWLMVSGAWLNSFLGYEFQAPVVINRYRITGGDAYMSTDSPNGWVFEGSQDGVTYTPLDTKNGQPNFGNSETRTYDFANTTAYKMYRIRFTANGGGSYVRICELDMISPPKPSPFYARLMTGGVLASDLDNEWDKYIVSSDLNGKITAGDNDVWNWSVANRTWTSTSFATAPTNKVIRGYSGNISTHTNSAPTTTSINSYRPIFILDKDFGAYLIQDGTELFRPNPEKDIWTKVGDAPVTSQMFADGGFLSFEEITDDMLRQLNAPRLIAHRNIVPTALLENVVPYPQLVVPTGDINIVDILGITSMQMSGTETSGKVRAAVSFDSGTSWYSYSAGTFVPISLTLTDLLASGISFNVLSAITGAEWEALRAGREKLRIAYAIEVDKANHDTGTDAFAVKVSLDGHWKKAIPGTDRTYRYTGNRTLQVTLKQNGNFKINY